MAEMIQTETHGRVGLIRLHRPNALNALCDQLMAELGAQLIQFDDDDAIGAIVLTGSDKAFAAGADIHEMADRRFPDIAAHDFIAEWEVVTRLRKPVIAAVAGFALGGGCELAMMCDLILAAPNAQFGQPEIQLGIIPGAGGTQRLIRAVGKAKAMDMILTGRRMNAEDAERSNLVARIVPDPAELVPEAIHLAERIAALSPPAVMLAKRAVNQAAETTLSQGVAYERSLFQALFGTPHQREGMAAFLNKRKPDFHAAPAADAGGVP